MKRSQINAIMRDADTFFRTNGIFLPPFAFWSPAEWADKGEEVREIVETGMGWDITDFGLGDFPRFGLVLFTLRNGRPDGTPRPYAEKLMICDVNQETPLHFHRTKTEDIINRRGGQLVFNLYNATDDDLLADTDVTVSVDGVPHKVVAGGRLVLNPGESITIHPRCYHCFWAIANRVLVGEVSSVNDDATDNHFLDALGRFPRIQEDTHPLYLLGSDYDKYWGAKK